MHACIMRDRDTGVTHPRAADEVVRTRAGQCPPCQVGQTRSAGGVAVASTRGTAMRSAACAISGIWRGSWTPPWNDYTEEDWVDDEATSHRREE